MNFFKPKTPELPKFCTRHGCELVPYRYQEYRAYFDPQTGKGEKWEQQALRCTHEDHKSLHRVKDYSSEYRGVWEVGPRYIVEANAECE